MNVPANIFRTYDIRGIYPNEINENIALHIGKAFGTYLIRNGLKTCVIGRDDRASSPSLQDSVVQGLLSTGVDVTDVEVTLMPLIHYFTCTQGFDAGVNITASHNPKKYNGIKLELKSAEPVALERLQELKKTINAEKYVIGQGNVISKDLSELYINDIAGRFKYDSDIENIKIILDCGNGATSSIAPRVFQKLGCNVLPINCSLNALFPNGVPDPENLEFMENFKEKVLNHKADLGIAFDTDGDRVGFIDSQGVIYNNDQILLLLAGNVLKKYPGGTILFDVKSSEIVVEYIKSLGGVPKMIKTGRTYFLEEMKKGAVLGAELSGHTYFGGDYFGYDDGIFTALKMVELLNKEKKPLNLLAEKLPVRISTGEIKIEVPDREKQEIVQKVIKVVGKLREIKRIEKLDGVRAYLSDTGWFLVRSSGTSPYLSIRMEAADTAEFDQVQKVLDSVLSRARS